MYVCVCVCVCVYIYIYKSVYSHAKGLMMAYVRLKQVV